jgi:hypothetical protein
MNPVVLVGGFVPLVLFSLLDGPVSAGDAGAIGAAAAIVIALVMLRRGIPVLPIVQAITLAAFAAIGFAGSPATQHWLTTYGRGVPSLVLAAFMLVTVPFAPFTAQLAHATVPREVWSSPRFIDLNRRISAAWGAAVLVLGLSRMLTAAVNTSTLHPLQAHLIQYGPAVVAVILAIRYTRRAVAEAHEAHNGSPADAQRAGSY